MLKRKLALLLVLVSSASCLRTREQTPADVAQQFYVKAINFTRLGLPAPTELKPVWPLMTPELQRLFERARKDRSEYEKRHPDLKPPWCDGYLFASLFEGPTGFQIGQVQSQGNKAEVTVNFEYIDSSDRSEWSDRLVLIQRDGRWLIDDILFDGKWAFKIGGSLKQALQPLPKEWMENG